MRDVEKVVMEGGKYLRLLELKVVCKVINRTQKEVAKRGLVDVRM